MPPLTKKQRTHLKRVQTLDQNKAKVRDYFLPLYQECDSLASMIVEESNAMAKCPDTIHSMIGTLAVLQLEEILLSVDPAPDEPNSKG